MTAERHPRRHARPEIGNRPMTVAGLVLLSGGFGLMAMLDADDSFAKVTLALLVFTTGMPAGTPEAARGSIGEALGVAAATGDSALAEVARTTFAHAMSSTFVAGAAAVLGSAVLAFLLLRDKKPVTETQPTVELTH